MRNIVFLSLLVAAGALGDENMTGKRELHMQRCPSAVPHSVTRVVDIPSGVEVWVRAPLDAVAQAEIHRRVETQLEVMLQTERGALEHTGLGTGSGKFGYCPGMLEGTSLQVHWLTDGAVMTIRPDRAEDVKRLQKITHQRARWLTNHVRAIAAR
jgi:hypothetical protein